MKLAVLALCASAATGFRPGPPKASRTLLKAHFAKVATAVSAAAINLHAEAAHAKSVLGVNGALDFGPLAGDQPGGEGTGKALGINDDSLAFVLLGVVGSVFLAFAQWQEKQDDDEDFFDAYDSCALAPRILSALRLDTSRACRGTYAYRSLFVSCPRRRVEVDDNRNRGRQGDEEGFVFGRKA